MPNTFILPPTYPLGFMPGFSIRLAPRLATTGRRAARKRPSAALEEVYRQRNAPELRAIVKHLDAGNHANAN